jgi:hypothetical protein
MQQRLVKNWHVWVELVRSRYKTRGNNSIEELTRRIDKTDFCWNWLGAHNDKGYGQAYYQGKLWYVHRLMYLFTHGKLDKNILVLHTCDNTSCCNPEHLWLGSQLDNMRDCAKKQRWRNQYSCEVNL